MLKHSSKIWATNFQDSLVHMDRLTLHLYREIARRLCRQGENKSLECIQYYLIYKIFVALIN